jgi:superfamily II DNA helicase RecQ
MPIKLFSVPALDSAAGEHEVNQFCAQHRVVSIERRLVTVHDRPLWCFCVEYVVPATAQGAATTGDHRSRIDYKVVLNEDDFRCYSRLRDLRKQIAEEEKVPVFTVFSNENLSAIAQQRPGSATALQAIAGIGEGKTKRYGERVLAVVASLGSRVLGPFTAAESSDQAEAPSAPPA